MYRITWNKQGGIVMIIEIANTIRGLAADMVEKAQSGHPGMPLGAAELGATLFSSFLKHDPHDPTWPNRDRFILSAGHGSALLYSLLHLSGYDLPLEELKQFRQLHSKTPGHPEYHITPGVETTTGPLGQGIGNAIGMALAERMLAERFNRPNYEIVDHYTYVIAGDGCMMEGVSAEASSLAGHLGLGKLIVLYDNNQISIEGSTSLAFTENVGQRYLAYGWQVIPIDGHDPNRIIEAISTAKADQNRPTLIIANTHIAKGSPLEGNHEAHGTPLGKVNIKSLKQKLGLPEEEFYIGPKVQAFFTQRLAEWQTTHSEWSKHFQAWSDQYPELHREWDRIMTGNIPDGIDTVLPHYKVGESVATRDAGGKALNALATHLPELVGGSADLAPSTKTYLSGKGEIQAGNYSGNNLHFGVREHAMGSILNGISLHGGFRVFGSTFLVFSDYMRPPIRLAALMHQPIIYSFTHDSFWVGEDGPTHQPVEQLEALRLIPNLRVIRPADANETTWAWQFAVKTNHPTALILSRQKLPVLTGTSFSGFLKGGYIIHEPETGPPDIILVASGSEVSLMIETANLLTSEAKQARVFSIPCREIFSEQDRNFRTQMSPPNIPVVIAEAGRSSGWYSLIPRPEETLMISLEQFGLSGPAEKLTVEFGFTAEAIVKKIKTKFRW